MATEFVYWDSCVFIDALQKTKGRYEALEPILDAAERGEIVLVSSFLTLAEVVKVQGADADVSIRGLSEAEVEQLIFGFFENPYIQLRPVDRLVTTQARVITRRFGVKPPDAIHIATAMLHPQVNTFHTYDATLTAKLANAALGLSFAQPV